MPAACFRRRAREWEYGRTCIDCCGPKAENATRCRRCWTENVKRTARYWELRTCPDCDGAKARNAVRCLRCTHVAKLGKPRVGPVAVAADHRWRRLRFGKEVAT